MRARILVVVPALLACAVLAQADEGKKGKKIEGTKGALVSVDSANKTFVFRTGKKKDPNAQEVTVVFDDKTKFVKISESGTADAKADDLGGKQRLAVVYETKDGKNIASKVTIIDLPKKKKNGG